MEHSLPQLVNVYISTVGKFIMDHTKSTKKYASM